MFDLIQSSLCLFIEVCGRERATLFLLTLGKLKSIHSGVPGSNPVTNTISIFASKADATLRSNLPLLKTQVYNADHSHSQNVKNFDS